MLLLNVLNELAGLRLFPFYERGKRVFNDFATSGIRFKKAIQEGFLWV